ncbi:MAG: hypothetical protein ACI9BO_000470, partial [Zhongshania sp.]
NFADKNAANGIGVTVANTRLVSGTGLASNYSLTQPTVTAANITAKVLAITGMAAVSKTYDDSTVASLTGGLLDTGIAGETLAFTGQTATFADKNVANGIGVTVANTRLVSGTGLASNYSLTQPTGLTANITALPDVSVVSVVSVVPVVPVVPIAAQNVITNIMSNILSLAGSPAEAGKPSRPIEVIPGSNVTMSIGNPASTLKIISGGIRLPVNLPDLKESEEDVLL